IRQVAQILRERGLIAYPTDSLYALGSALGNQEGKDRILRLRNLDERHDFTLVCADFSQMGQFVHISNRVFRALKAPHPARTPSYCRRPKRCHGSSYTRRRRPWGCGSPITPSYGRSSQNWASPSSPQHCSFPISLSPSPEAGRSKSYSITSSMPSSTVAT